MSSGFVTTNLSRRPDRVKSGKGTEVNLPPALAFALRTKFSVNDYRWPNPVSSYRTGPSYDREASKPGAIVGNTYVSEVLAEAAGDIGHEFLMRRVTDFRGLTTSHKPLPTFDGYLNQLSNPIPVFPISPKGGGVSYQDFIDKSYGFVKSDSALVTLGTSFIKDTNPIQSQVNLLSDIAEAFTSGFYLPDLLGKQIISAAIKSSKRRDLIRSTGGEYLNYLFGYKPLANDIAKVGFLIDHVNKIVNQWIKDNGTIVRRRRKVPGSFKVGRSASYTQTDDIFGNSTTVNMFAPPPTGGWTEPTVAGVSFSTPQSSWGQVEQTGLWVERLSSEITFSAGYEYDFSRMGLPVEAGQSAQEIMHNSAVRDDLESIVFGLDPSSLGRAAFDATPFSWLLDWFVNVGDVLDNFRGLNSRGVQMLWGYVTEKAEREFYFQHRMTYKPTNDVYFQSSGFSAQKAIRRIRATPFGFGTSFGSLTSDQSAILAALGASRIK